MSKLIRLTVEALHAFKLYKNPFTYIKERFKKFPNQTITLKLRNGLQLKLNTNTNEIGTLNEIWHLGIYDRFLPLLKSDSTVIDVGANIGTFSIKAGNIVKKAKQRGLDFNADTVQKVHKKKYSEKPLSDNNFP